MEKNRSLKIIAFAALFVEIKGSANVKAQSWNIHFENLEKSLDMTAKEINEPKIQANTTLISGLKVEFDKPGQVAEYTFDIVNSGTFDSIVTGVTIKTPICTGNGENAATDAANVCKNISTKITDSTGKIITNGTVLKAGEKIEGCKIDVTYNADIPVNELAKDDVVVEDIDVTIVFSQN